MSPEEINEQRVLWHEKAQKHLVDTMFASMEQSLDKHKACSESLITALKVLWRLDGEMRKMEDAELKS